MYKNYEIIKYLFKKTTVTILLTLLEKWALGCSYGIQSASKKKKSNLHNNVCNKNKTLYFYKRE